MSNTPLTEIRNIGPAMAEAFQAAGIPDAETLRDLGTDAAYERLLRSGSRPHFIAYYVIEMGLQGRPWNDCKGKEKDALKVRFEAIKAQCRDAAPAPRAIERILDQIGTGLTR